MASFNGSGREGEDEFIRPPHSPRLPPPPERLCPDTEDNVAQQTEDIFKNFMYQSYRQDNIRQEYDNNPRVPELINLASSTPSSPAAEIGRQLARIGDDINEKYSDQFSDMIRRLNIDSDTAYEAFAGVARKLFENGINWGRVVTLLCFGYRIALQTLKDHMGKFASFLKKIIEYVVKFIITEKIAKWIADHGGWRAALTFIPSTSMSTLVMIAGVALLSVAAVYYLHTRS